MASVRKTDPDDKPTRVTSSVRTSPAGAAGLCRACGSPVAQASTGRPKTFCSDACRKRSTRTGSDQRFSGKDAGSEFPDTKTGVKLGSLVTKVAAQEASSESESTQGRLGTTGECSAAAGQGLLPKQNRRWRIEAARSAAIAGTERGPWDRNHRFQLREDLQRLDLTPDKAAMRCGAGLLMGAVTQTLRAGRSAFSGLCTCGKIHLCPVCSEKIRKVRQDTATTYADAWESAGYGMALLTATLRHYGNQSLGTIRKSQRHPKGFGLVAVQHHAWRDAFGAGDRAWRALRDEFGLVGYLRSWECTFTTNGGHPHFHAQLFLEEPWEVWEGEDFEERARARWVDAVVKAGGVKPGQRSLKIDLARRGEAGKTGRYLFKQQYNNKAEVKQRVGLSRGLVAEVMRGDVKTSRPSRDGHKGRASFEVAEDATLKVPGSAELWSEFAYASHGVRALYLSNGMKAKLAALVEVDDRTDLQIASEDEPADPLCIIPAETWHRHIRCHRGRALELLRAAEHKGQLGVRLLILEWGLVWGQDVLPPPVLGGSAGPD